MFDFKFDWNDSLSVGIPEIDEQHRELFRIGRDIEQLVLRKGHGVTPQQLLMYLCEIREYITYHFYKEEEYIAMINPEALEEHKRRHELFKKRVNEVDYVKLMNDEYLGLQFLKSMLQEWIFEHIIVEDSRDLKQ